MTQAGAHSTTGLYEAYIATRSAPPPHRRQRLARVPDHVDVKAVRQRLGLTQAEFASRYGFELGSIRNWEQGRRRPEGPARVLLRVIEQEPEAVQRALTAR